MKKGLKTALILSVSFILAGIIILVSVLCTTSFDFEKLSFLSFASVDYDTYIYDVENDFTDVYIEEPNLDINFATSEDDTTQVKVLSKKGTKHKVYVENKKLIVKYIQDIPKVEFYFNFSVSTQSPNITIYLPAKTYNALSVKGTSSNITIHDMINEFEFKTANIKSTSGSIGVFDCVTDTLVAESNSGDIEVAYNSPKDINISTTSGWVLLQKLSDATNIEVSTNSGDIDFMSVDSKSISAESASGEQHYINVNATSDIIAKSNSGDIELGTSDASELYFETDSGDVIGQLRSDKNFLVDTDSGNVDVPFSDKGGKCEVHTTSGDVDFSIQTN